MIRENSSHVDKWRAQFCNQCNLANASEKPASLSCDDNSTKAYSMVHICLHHQLIKFRIKHTKERVLNEISCRQAIEILLYVEHVQFVKVAVEPGCVWSPIGIDKTVNSSQPTY